MIYNFEELLNMSLNDVIKTLFNNGMLIQDLKIFDLVLNGGKPIITGNGVYIFLSGINKAWYVGKAESRSFIERIPSHFDLREGVWFNTLLRKLKKQLSVNIYDAAIFSGELRLVLINFKERENLEKYCVKLERLLRLQLNPKLNSFINSKRNMNIKATYRELDTLKDILSRIP